MFNKNNYSLNPFLLFLFPASITVLPALHGIVLALAVFCAFIIYFSRQDKQVQVISTDERQVIVVVALMVVAAFFVTVVVSLDLAGIKNITKFILLLLVFPVYYYFRAIGVNKRWFWYGLVAGSLVSAVVGVYEITYELYKPGYDGRAKGATHPIIFGDLALLMGVMSLAGLGWFKARGSWQVLFPIIAIGSGLLASVLSSTRGGWVALPVFAIILLWSSRLRVSRMQQLLGSAAFAFVLVLVYSIPQTGMQQKIEQTVENVEAYLESDVSDIRRNTSIGSRLEMWQASFQIFKEHPLIGVGWGKYQENAQELVDQGLRNVAAAEWRHPHNQFLSSLVSGGILALIATIMLFYAPARIFFDVIKLRNRSPDAQMFALAGLVMVVGFAIFNLSESFLERSRTVSFFIFYLAVCMAGIRDDKVISHKS